MFTGLFHISGGGGQFVLFFVQGRLVDIYQLQGRVWETKPAGLWDEIKESLEGNLRIRQFSSEALRIFRLLLEANFTEARTKDDVRAVQIIDQFASFQHNGKAGLGFIDNKDGICAVVVLDPASDSFLDALLMAPTGTQTGAGVMNQVRMWADHSCSLSFYTHNPFSNGWKEYDLRVSMAGLLKFSLDRYQQIVGRFLVSDLADQLNILFNSQSWALTLIGDQISNRHFFDSLDEATHAYIRVVDFVDNQMELVVGEKIAGQVWQDGIAKLPMFSKQIIREHIAPASRISRIAQ